MTTKAQRLIRRVLTVAALLLAAVSTGPFARAATVATADSAALNGQFVYVNDNNYFAPNSVEGYAVAADGSLSPLPGSPYLTGGMGLDALEVSLIATRVAYRPQGRFLYAANDGDNTISTFKIDPVTGIPTVRHSPVKAGVIANGFTGEGIGLALTGDGNTLYAIGKGSELVTIFAIDAQGRLLFRGSATITTFPCALKVTPNGAFLMVSSCVTNNLDTFSIDQMGLLSPVPSSPLFTYTIPGQLDSDCASQTVFVGDAGVYALESMEIYYLGVDGSLKPSPSSPFRPVGNAAYNTAGVVLSPSGKYLYVTNPGSNQLTTFQVHSNGSLNLVNGDPFNTANPQGQPGGVAINSAGTFLFTATSGFGISQVESFALSTQGGMTPAPGSPYALVSTTFPTAYSIVAVPGKTCN